MDRRKLAPLDEQGLNSLALRYVERFATTRAKLRSYLDRKVRERGWADGSPPDIGVIAEQFAERGYVDDAGYALAKSRSLTGRGYGKRRLGDALRAAGVGEQDSEAARLHAEEEAVTAAIRFAERRRIGPFARSAAALPAERDKALRAMVRAGHDFALARAIVAMGPVTDPDRDAIAEQLRTLC
ncbi:regulatory protein RecX [Sphingomonas sp. F9_3S_D5_B_2]